MNKNVFLSYIYFFDFKIITNTIQNTISLTFEDVLLQHLQTHHRQKYCICMWFLPVSISYFLSFRAFWPRCKYHLSLQQMIAENYSSSESSIDLFSDTQRDLSDMTWTLFKSYLGTMY